MAAISVVLSISFFILTRFQELGICLKKWQTSGMVAVSRTNMGQGGRLVIPASYRRELHLDAGQEVLLSLEEGTLRIIPSQESFRRAFRDAA